MGRCKIMSGSQPEKCWQAATHRARSWEWKAKYAGNNEEEGLPSGLCTAGWQWDQGEKVMAPSSHEEGMPVTAMNSSR